jgi:two-component system, NarL family, nitrate/nitrite response regulator NarL
MIKLMIADDHQIFLDGLRSLLQQAQGIEVVGTALNGRQLLGQIPHLLPDVVLLDINMPEMDGIETARQLRSTHPRIQIIMLTMHERADFITKLIELGVAGYLLKNSSRQDLIDAILTVHSGGTFFSKQVTHAVMDSFRKKSPAPTPSEEAELSPRERDVLRLIAQEHTTAEIADKLFISPHTVESHRKNLLSKLGKKNTAGLAAWAAQHGFI